MISVHASFKSIIWCFVHAPSTLYFVRVLMCFSKLSNFPHHLALEGGGACGVEVGVWALSSNNVGVVGVVGVGDFFWKNLLTEVCVGCDCVGGLFRFISFLK